MAGLALINLNLTSIALITLRSTIHDLTMLTIPVPIHATSVLATAVVIIMLITIVIMIMFAINL